MLKSMNLQGLLRRLSRYTSVEANTNKFKGRFKFNKVRICTIDNNKYLLFFYNEEERLLFTCDSYYLSRTKNDTIYINC